HRRGEYLAMANVSAAKSLLDSGKYSSSPGIGIGMNDCLNSWAYNPWYGMYTYMPCRGSLFRPYAFRFCSPYTLIPAYYVPPSFYAGRNSGFGGTGHSYPTAAPTSTGYSGVMSSAGSYSGSSSGVSNGVSAAGGGVSSAGGAAGGGHGGSAGGGHH